MWKKENDVKKFLKSLNINTLSPACDYFVMSVLIVASGAVSSGKDFEHEILRQVSNWYTKDLNYVSKEIMGFIESNALSSQLFGCEKKMGSVMCEIAQRVAVRKI